jgi:hypothetical protein
MVGLPVCSHLFGMAVSALFDQEELPLRIAGFRDKVFLVAIIARGRFRIVPAKKLLCMNAFAVILELTRVTAGTKLGDFRFTRGRSRIAGRENVVRSVAGLACRRPGIARRLCTAVYAQLVCQRLFPGSALPPEEMADSAVHLRDFTVRMSAHTKMTLATGDAAVYRLFEEGTINKDLHAFLAMTVEAGFRGHRE